MTYNNDNDYLYSNRRLLLLNSRLIDIRDLPIVLKKSIPDLHNHHIGNNIRLLDFTVVILMGSMSILKGVYFLGNFPDCTMLKKNSISVFFTL